MNPTWRRHCFELTALKAGSLRREEKQTKEAVQTCEETVMFCLRRTAWALSCHTTKRQRTPPVRTPRFDPKAHGIPTHAQMCRHR